MAFGDFKSLGEVALKYQITLHAEGFIRPQPMTIDPAFRQRLEAKSDNFDMGWGQCLAAMLAAQKENSHPKEPIQGVVSSGMIWYFGRLTEQTLVQDLRPFVVTRLDELFGALKFVFDEASQLARNPESRP